MRIRLLKHYQTNLDQFGEIIKVFFLVNGDLIVLEDDSVVLNLVLEAHAQRVVAGEVSRLSDGSVNSCISLIAQLLRKGQN